jgi:sporadic carbohydrate cluster 2OG-Fe(II) oxygenase
MKGRWSFLPDDEARLCRDFMETRYVIRDAESREDLDAIQALAARLAARALDLAVPGSAQDFLDLIHRHVDPSRLNALRQSVYRGLNDDPEFRRRTYRLAACILSTLIGNELAMQRRVNLSIQLPDDDSSLLPVHADVWSGDSPFELVLWVPLVDCFDSKSMFIMPPAEDERLQTNMASRSGQSAEALYQAIADQVTFLDISYGSVLVFSQNLMHGNRVNRVPQTRWSLNCRFKAVLSPYGDKRLGEFFEPLVIRPASYLGMTYRLPDGFDE